MATLMPPHIKVTFTSPAALSFTTKLKTITGPAVIRRAAELARGDRQFESGVFQEPEIAARIAEGTRRLKAQYPDDGDGLGALHDRLKDLVRTHHMRRPPSSRR